jgi:hypothetical protein
VAQPADHPESEPSLPEALTSIHRAYTLAATNEHAEGEVEDLMIRHFIETLAEVALSVASRKAAQQENTR